MASEVGSLINAGSSVCASSASLNCRCATRLVFPGEAEADGVGRPGRLHELSSNARASPPVRWRGAAGRPVRGDARRRGQAVAPAATATLTLVTLSPTAVGDFTLTTELETRGSQLQIGDPTPFHLSGFLFKGRGNGHGLGMSQWGARGRAGAGDDDKKILPAYYKNSQIDSRDTSGMVRIALTHGPIDLARPWPRVFGPLPFVAGPVTV